MIIKNTTDKSTPKPISIGTYVIMPGEECNVSDDVVYVDEFDRLGKKTGNKKLLPAVVLLAGMNQISYEETKQEEVEEVEEKPRRGRKPKTE